MSGRARAVGSTGQLADGLRTGHDLFIQRTHAGAILVAPAILTVWATYVAARGGFAKWQLFLALGGYVLTMLGVTVGFHRLFAHRAFTTSAWIRICLAILGSMAAQGPPIYWVSNHRRHHANSDSPGDPHSPHLDSGEPRGTWAGFRHAHFGWMFTHELTDGTAFSRDLYQDRYLMWVNQRYLWWVALGLLAPAAVGVLMEMSLRAALSGFLWGGGVRLFVSFHMTASINSITHLFGYRSFDTRDHSRNNAWLGLVTLGEAWHNNHHASPANAVFGLRWWETDIGGAFIRLLEFMRLAANVRRSLKFGGRSS